MIVRYDMLGVRLKYAIAMKKTILLWDIAKSYKRDNEIKTAISFGYIKCSWVVSSESSLIFFFFLYKNWFLQT